MSRASLKSFNSSLQNHHRKIRPEKIAEMSNEPFAEIRARVVELLIVSAERLEVFPVVKYSAMSLFADRLCNTLSDSRHESGEDIDHWLLRPLTESSLQLFALISLWISSKMHTSRPVSVKSLKSLGDKMINDQHFTTRDYVEAEVVFMQVKVKAGRADSFKTHDRHDFIYYALTNFLLAILFFSEISKIGEMVNFEVCMDIMDLVYEKGTRYSDPVIFAASILASALALVIASYLITVPKQRHEFPLLQWVVFIASFREDDVLELVEDILKLVLHPSNNVKPL
ncbi:unnamed protein product [Rhodiola kirilowii]